MSWGPSHLLTFAPQLPPHCEPTGPFLRQFSSIFHVCIPTPLAFISTLLGSCSILAWLFAQLPQIFKNYRLKSTSGLSIFFLVEWCLGDMSNLSGAVLTNQATWQIIVGSYYCLVDIVLVGQWFWYESLQRGESVRRLWKKKSQSSEPDDDMQQVAGAASRKSLLSNFHQTSGKSNASQWPSYGSIQNDNDKPLTTSPARIVHAAPRRPANPLPSPSPRSTLLLTVAIALCSINVTASPTHSIDSHSYRTKSPDTPAIGTIVSWTSTVLYLLSRLPQLIKNFRRRSTAGLSPLLFLAAFLGNFFYSSSLIFNPCLWQDFDPYGGRGWAGPEGSESAEWMWRALPFFLGSGGVLIMDAAVGVQFWLWGESNEEFEIRDLQREANNDGLLGYRPKNETPKGWMRGWVPTVSISESLNSLRRFSPALRAVDRRVPESDERDNLLSRTG